MSLSLPACSRMLREMVPIIGVLLASLALGGCSAVRLGYNQADTLVYWWLDRYFDFDAVQSPPMRAALRDVHLWHRRHELPQLVQTVQQLQVMAHQQVDAAQVCRLVDALQTRVEAALARMTPAIAELALSLKEEQFAHLEQEFVRRDQQWREDWMDGTVRERAERRVRQIVERAESFYGDLNAAQRDAVRAHIDRSSFDAPRQFREMKRRHADAVQVLRRIRSGETAPAQASGQVRALLARTLKAPSAEYRRYMDQLVLESCQAMAALHNASTPAQRERLHQTLRGYEDDARHLVQEEGGT